MARYELDVGCRARALEHQGPGERNVDRCELVEQLCGRSRHTCHVPEHHLENIRGFRSHQLLLRSHHLLVRPYPRIV